MTYPNVVVTTPPGITGACHGQRIAPFRHRQRPQTASDVTFMGLEDETGLMNVLVSPGLWARYQRVAGTAKALVIRGIIRNSTGAPTLIADKLEPLAVAEALAGGSRDFR